MERNIKELFDIKSFKSTISVWVCRDWDGPHIFAEKPKRINDPANEWYASVASLDNRAIVTGKQIGRAHV